MSNRSIRSQSHLGALPVVHLAMSQMVTLRSGSVYKILLFSPNANPKLETEMKITTDNYTLYYTRHKEGWRGTIRQFYGPRTSFEYAAHLQKKVFRAFPDWSYRLDRDDSGDGWDIVPFSALENEERNRMMKRLARLATNAQRELGIPEVNND
jgi:hypothetical protein